MQIINLLFFKIWNIIDSTKVSISPFPSDLKWFGFKIGSTKSKGTFRIHQAPYTSHLKWQLYCFFSPSQNASLYSSALYTHLLHRKNAKVNKGEGFWIHIGRINKDYKLPNYVTACQKYVEIKISIPVSSLSLNWRKYFLHCLYIFNKQNPYKLSWIIVKNSLK